MEKFIYLIHKKFLPIEVGHSIANMVRTMYEACPDMIPSCFESAASCLRQSKPFDDLWTTVRRQTILELSILSSLAYNSYDSIVPIQDCTMVWKKWRDHCAVKEVDPNLTFEERNRYSAMLKTAEKELLEMDTKFRDDPFERPESMARNFDWVEIGFVGFSHQRIGKFFDYTFIRPIGQKQAGKMNQFERNHIYGVFCSKSCIVACPDILPSNTLLRIAGLQRNKHGTLEVTKAEIVKRT